MVFVWLPKLSIYTNASLIKEDPISEMSSEPDELVKGSSGSDLVNFIIFINKVVSPREEDGNNTTGIWFHTMDITLGF